MLVNPKKTVSGIILIMILVMLLALGCNKDTKRPSSSTVSKPKPAIASEQPVDAQNELDPSTVDMWRQTLDLYGAARTYAATWRHMIVSSKGEEPYPEIIRLTYEAPNRVYLEAGGYVLVCDGQQLYCSSQTNRVTMVAPAMENIQQLQAIFESNIFRSFGEHLWPVALLTGKVMHTTTPLAQLKLAVSDAGEFDEMVKHMDTLPGTVLRHLGLPDEEPFLIWIDPDSSLVSRVAEPVVFGRSITPGSIGETALEVFTCISQKLDEPVADSVFFCTIPEGNTIIKVSDPLKVFDEMPVQG